MPRINDLAHEVLGEVVANSLNVDGWTSAEEFLRKYDAAQHANKHSVGQTVSVTAYLHNYCGGGIGCNFCLGTMYSLPAVHTIDG